METYVEEGIFCEIPIGRDDTWGAGVWVLYRDWLYREKISKKFWRAKLEEGMLEV